MGCTIISNDNTMIIFAYLSSKKIVILLYVRSNLVQCIYTITTIHSFDFRLESEQEKNLSKLIYLNFVESYTIYDITVSINNTMI